MFYPLRRIVCWYKFKLSFRLCLKYFSKKVEYVEMPSALYAGFETKGKVFSSLDPYLDINSMFSDIDKLKSDLRKRKLEVNVDSLYQQSMIYEKLIDLIKSNKNIIKNLNAELRKLKSINSETKEAIDLKDRITDMNKTVSAANEELKILERTFIIPFLQLPNSLHKNTMDKDECLFSLFSKPEFSFPAKSHFEIGEQNHELYIKDVSPSSYYFKGDLARLELVVGEFVMSRFQEHDFRCYANVDTARAILAEGCGIKVKNNNNLTLDDDYCAFNQVQFLYGSSFLTSFVALFCKGVINFVKPLPMRLVTTGRRYELTENNRTGKIKSLFDAIQSTSVSAFVVYPTENSEEAIVNEIAMLMNQTYTELGLHFKLIQYGASKLKPYESLAIGLCLYSPYLKNYVEVGRISLCQDFISKRLQIYESLGKKKATFLGMIYVEIINVKNWIGCLMENTQSVDGKYSIPKCLKSFFY